MTYSAKELINARIEAHRIAEKLVIAYWVKDDSQFYHISVAIKSFEKLAKTLGYGIKKQDAGDLVGAKK